MIVDVIKTVCESLDPVSGESWIFLDALPDEANENPGYDTAGKPVAILLHPIKSKNVTSRLSGKTEKVHLIVIQLLQASKLADKQVDRNIILTRMYAAEPELLKKLLLHDNVQEADITSETEEVFNFYDNNFDGLEITITVKFIPETYC